MNKSDEIKDLATALSKAQNEFKPIFKTSSNPFYKSSYAALDEVISCTQKALSKNGLAVIQGNEATESGVVITTLLAHTSGQWVESKLTMTPTKNDPQGIGSAITYGRRYALSAILGVASEEDDDANSASTKNESYKAPVKSQTNVITTCVSCHAPAGRPHATGCPNA